MKELEHLLSVIRTLRSPQGCPWDRKQTLKTVAPQVLEESYELLESLEEGSVEDIREELGDLMFLTLFIAVIAEQEGAFTLDETVREVAEKLIRRHPHVFGDSKTENIDEILETWEAIKSREDKKQKRETIFDGIPKTLPTLEKYNKILQKIERKTQPLRKNKNVYRSLTVDDLNREFSKKHLKLHLESLLKRAYVEEINVSELLREISRDTMEDYL